MTDSENQFRGTSRNEIDSVSTRRAACFATDTFARLVDGSSMRIDELSVGDEVLCNRRGQYSQSIRFSHASHSVVASLRNAILDSGHALHASHGHHVYIRRKSREISLVRMREVELGDWMIL